MPAVDRPIESPAACLDRNPDHRTQDEAAEGTDQQRGPRQVGQDPTKKTSQLHVAQPIPARYTSTSTSTS
jgi:hypothetical protein